MSERELWREAAQQVFWYEPPQQVLDDSNPPFYRWFPDGVTNACYNALDIHVAEGRGEQAALIYDSPVTQTQKTYSYADLLEQVATLAGALQDTKRAILLGEKTFGKFSVQQVQQIDPTEGTAFRITTAYYYTPNGRSLHEEGIKPDIEVKSQDFSAYENKMITKLLKGKYLAEYVKKYPDPKSDEKHLGTLVDEIEAAHD